MIYEVSQQFFFDAAHSLKRDIEAEGSRRIHGHTYYAEVFLQGVPDKTTGMVIDLGELTRQIEAVKASLDHRCLDDVSELGAPTLENLCAFIARRLGDLEGRLSRVKVWRTGVGDSCSLRLLAN